MLPCVPYEYYPAFLFRSVILLTDLNINDLIIYMLLFQISIFFYGSVIYISNVIYISKLFNNFTLLTIQNKR